MQWTPDGYVVSTHLYLSLFRNFESGVMSASPVELNDTAVFSIKTVMHAAVSLYRHCLTTEQTLLETKLIINVTRIGIKLQD